MSAAPSTQSAAAAIRASAQEFCRLANAGDAAALAELFYADDAVVLPPGMPPVQGKAAIREFWTEFIASTQAQDVTLDTTQVEASGDLAYAIGSYSFTAGGAPQSGKYLVAYRRQADGRYLCVADSFGPNA